MGVQCGEIVGANGLGMVAAPTGVTVEEKYGEIRAANAFHTVRGNGWVPFRGNEFGNLSVVPLKKRKKQVAGRYLGCCSASDSHWRKSNCNYSLLLFSKCKCSIIRVSFKRFTKECVNVRSI